MNTKGKGASVSTVSAVQPAPTTYKGETIIYERITEISRDLNHRPVVFIRFNPDAYTDQHGKNATSECIRVDDYQVVQESRMARENRHNKTGNSSLY